MMDDDIYLNVDKLVELLQCFDPEKSWYLGRRSIKAEKVMPLDGNVTVSLFKLKLYLLSIKLSYALEPKFGVKYGTSSPVS